MTSEDLTKYYQTYQKAEEYYEIYEKVNNAKENLEFAVDGFLWLID